MGRAAGTLVALLLLTGAQAKAAELLSSQPPSPPPVWYGWQILVSDAVTAGTWIAADATGSRILAGVGAATYLVAPPIIHDRHGDFGKVLGSFGLRLGAPLVGALAGLGLASIFCDSAPSANDEPSLSHCQERGTVIGFFGAMVAVSIFDIARSRTTPSGLAPAHAKRSEPTWTPTATPTRSGAILGFAAIF
jgi:hypothetical protein